MADSETSTTLPVVTRRDLLAGAATAPLVLPWAARDPSPAISFRNPETDPVLGLWRNWRDAWATMEACCAEQQRLEHDLVQMVGYPRVAVPVAGCPEPLYATTAADIDRLLGTAPETANLRKKLQANLVAHLARWDAAAQGCGLAAAAAREDAAFRRSHALVDNLFAVPATTLAGVAAKLAVVITLGEPAPEDDEFPWPYLRSTLADLERLADLGTALSR